MGQNHGQEGHKATENTTPVRLRSCMQARTYGMTFLGGAHQYEFPHFSPAVQSKKNTHLPYNNTSP